MNEESIDIEMMKRLASVEVEALIESRSIIFEQHVAAYKWLLASLLAINSGGAATVLGMQISIPDHARLVTIVLFVNGIIFSLLSSFLSQKFNERMVKPLTQMIGYWTTVAIDGQRDDEFEQGLNGNYNTTVKYSWVVSACGWISVLSFIAGSLYAAYNVSYHAQSAPKVTNNVKG